MAFDDIEIEIKFCIDEKLFLEVKNKLKKIAKFDKISEQSDEYFDLSNRTFINSDHPVEWLSIRKRSGKNILNYKKWYFNEKGDFTHCDEVETKIDNAEKLDKIFSLIDLKKLVVVNKKRETYNYNDEFEIALDIVADLGYFIEIEALKNLGGIEETRKKMFEFIKDFGIEKSDEVNKGYAYMMMKKKGLIK